MAKKSVPNQLVASAAVVVKIVEKNLALEAEVSRLRHHVSVLSGRVAEGRRKEESLVRALAGACQRIGEAEEEVARLSVRGSVASVTMEEPPYEGGETVAALEAEGEVARVRLPSVASSVASMEVAGEVVAEGSVASREAPEAERLEPDPESEGDEDEGSEEGEGELEVVVVEGKVVEVKVEAPAETGIGRWEDESSEEGKGFEVVRRQEVREEKRRRAKGRKERERMRRMVASGMNVWRVGGAVVDIVRPGRVKAPKVASYASVAGPPSVDACREVPGKVEVMDEDVVVEGRVEMGRRAEVWMDARRVRWMIVGRPIFVECRGCGRKRSMVWEKDFCLGFRVQCSCGVRVEVGVGRRDCGGVTVGNLG